MDPKSTGLNRGKRPNLDTLTPEQAAALILAEIERLDRADQPQVHSDG